MIRHAMAYVQMAQKVRAELGEDDRLTPQLARIEERLLAAEVELVRAYAQFRLLLQGASTRSPRAAKYLERTTWDLT